MKTIIIEDNHMGDSGIVYCLSRARVEATAKWLTEEGFKALHYHAGMEKSHRQTNQDKFLKEEGIIMVATIAFGMGIDKPGVRFVAHLDLPNGGYRLGKDCKPIFCGEETVLLREEIFSKKTGRSKVKKSKKQKTHTTLSNKLEMVQTRPVTIKAFGQLSGVGKDKLERYADSFLAFINKSL